MADRTFEMTLERMFAEAPVFGDSDLFALAVSERLNRGWSLRQLLIGGLGMLGGLIGGAQVLASGLVSRLDAVTSYSRGLLFSRLPNFTPSHIIPGFGTASGEVVWMAGALAAVAVGLALTRVVREI
jgi:hypothetical protein